MKPIPYRFRRMAAIFIDWNLCCLPALLICGFLSPFVAEGNLPVPILLPFLLSFPVLFLFRERLFRGRSLGNRLMKLVVLDRRSLQPLTSSALTTRSIMFLFLSGLEILLLLTTGSTLGDRAVAALVLHQDDIPENPPQPTPTSGRQALVTILAFVLGIVVLMGVIFLALERVKDEPHYALAYSYLMESEAIAQLDAQPEDVRLSGYSQSSSIRNGVSETKAAFTFQVQGQQFTVVCHWDGNSWYICEECTLFH